MPKAKAEAPAAPIWFYHLERSSLDDVLPELVDRCLKRAWRVLIRASDSGDRTPEENAGAFTGPPRRTRCPSSR